MSTPIRDQKVFLGGLALTEHIHTIDLDTSFEALDDARLGDKTAKITLGRGQAAMSLAGYWDPANFASVDSELFDSVGAERAYIIDLTGAGEGGVAYLGDILVSGRPLNLVHGKQAGMTIAGLTRNIIPVRGELDLLRTGFSTEQNGAGSNLGAVAAGEKLVAAYSVYGGTSINLSIVIESDDSNGFGTPTTRINFGTVTAQGGAMLTANGAITDTWYRAKVTYTAGSALAVAVAIGIV